MGLKEQNGLESVGAYLKAKDMGYGVIESTRMLSVVYGISIVEAKSIIVATDNDGMSLSEYQKGLLHDLQEALNKL